MDKLETLKQENLADIKIHSIGVDELKKMLYIDGIKEEIDFLFDLNDAVLEKENASRWSTFFVTAISDYLLKNKTSRSMINKNATIWLKERIGIDDIEKNY